MVRGHDGVLGVGPAARQRHRGGVDPVADAQRSTCSPITGMANEASEGHPEFSGRRSPGDTKVVREVGTAGTLEAESQQFIGVDRRAPFRVLRLSNPVRVIVDVRTDR